MSGLHHPFDQSGDVPNRTGGKMNVREALEANRGTRYCDHEGFDDHCHNCTAWLVKGEVVADIAPIIGKALRATAQEMQRLYGVPLDDVVANHWIHECVTAGIAAMMEES